MSCAEPPESRPVPVGAGGDTRPATPLPGDQVGHSTAVSLLRIQRDLAVGLVGCNDFGRCLAMLLDAAVRLEGFDCGGVWMLDRVLGEVSLVASHHLGGDFLRVMEGRFATFAGRWTFSVGEIHRLAEVDPSGEVVSAMNGEGIGGVVGLDIFVDDRWFVWLGLSSHDGGEPLGGAVQALGELAGFVRGAVAAIQKRQIREDARHELQLAVEGSGHGTWEIDLRTGRMGMSGRARKLHGWAGSGPLDLNMAELYVFPDDRETFRTGIQVAVGTKGEFALEYRTADGLRWVSSEALYIENPSPCILGVSRDISARKRLEDDLLDLEATLGELVQLRTAELERANAELLARSTTMKQALEGSGAGGWHLDLLSGRVRLDARNRDIYGFGPQEDLTLEGVVERFHPDSRSMVMERLAWTVMPGSGDDWNIEFRIVHPERGDCWLSARGRVFRDVSGRAVEMAGINIDITDLKDADARLRQLNEELEREVGARTRELRESEARFKSLADAIFDGVVISQAGIIVDVNPQAEAMFGCRPGEAVGCANLAFVAPESFETAAASLREGRLEAYEWTGLRMDGTRIPVESCAKLLEWKGRLTRVAVIRDLSESRRVAAAIAAQRIELERARGVALMGEISAGIVHQISQPLSAVGSNLAAMKAWPHDCTRACCNVPGLIDEVAASVGRMRDIVRRIRVLAGPRPIAPSTTRINQIVTDVLPLLKLDAESRLLGLESDLTPDLPVLSADPAQLIQMVVHLVRNVFDVCDSHPSRVVVRISTRILPGAMLELAVGAKGLDLTEGNRGLLSPDVFTGQGAAGVSLRLCQMIVHNHHGNIEICGVGDHRDICCRVVLPTAGPGPNTKV